MYQLVLMVAEPLYKAQQREVASKSFSIRSMLGLDSMVYLAQGRNYTILSGSSRRTYEFVMVLLDSGVDVNALSIEKEGQPALKSAVSERGILLCAWRSSNSSLTQELVSTVPSHSGSVTDEILHW